ncbi:MAG: aminotransferase class V-fold PLP-dependent enzyme [Gammaproteobacteria bacterium]|nr:aminotransferase class V-fold PLP-dependent enzyme [Gammaproteobacteria bacterium]NIM73019.1 aminotransferase class V-fold PLP-dependent enzyme [Gammaproteobacteria bacterium]NIN38635.1 aminotransferase class V-fold PLP-dependent enzyme [Gammaproteobacteria bacterium]NIO24771.1 aminotransferase class V-fold PLP-dependent enzyme [Gammaproteobacteria bacterium]NIO65374.1 aminotransferase class V-fold PLP-dependent enzyme [Gammaproteobacteria bacterium]
MSNVRLDVNFCRGFFPPLANGEAYLENAGGSYAPRHVIEAIEAYMRECQCQPSWRFAASRSARERLDRSQSLIAEAINADRDEIVIGPSTTLNVYVLAHALAPLLERGSEIVVTNQDHEANGGAWRRLAERGVVVREWRVDPLSGDLDLEALDALLGPRTRLVCFPHVSNIVGSLNDARAITARAHAVGAMVCIDGVATVAHQLPDMKSLDADFYLFSTYKMYGPHLAVLYAKREHMEAASNQNHFFHEGNVPEKLHPGGLSYESAASIAGIVDYLEAVHAHHFDAEDNDLRARLAKVYGLFQTQESSLMARVLDYLAGRTDIRLIGRDTSDATRRAPTFSVTVAGRDPGDVAARLAERGVCVGHGHFYAYRCVDALGIDPARGVLRFSMVHYNTLEEVDRLTAAMDAIA